LKKTISIISILIIIVLTYGGLFAEESDTVLLRWKVPGDEVYGFKTSMERVFDAGTIPIFESGDLFRDSNLKEKIFEEISSIRFPEKFSLVTLLKPIEKNRLKVEMISVETSDGKMSDDSLTKLIKEIDRTFTGLINLKAQITDSGEITSFYLEPRQKNILALFFQLPKRRVRVGDTWSLDVNLLTMGSDFICEESGRINCVKLSSLKHGEKGDTIAVLDYTISEYIRGKSDAGNIRIATTFIGRGEFLVEEGRWRKFSGIIQGESSIFASVSFRHMYIMAPLKKVPDELANMSEDISALAEISMALQFNNIKKARKILEEKPRLVNKELSNGGTILIEAIKLGKIEFIEYLLTKGADINKGSDKEGTPMEVAIAGGNNEIMDLLKKHGAKADISIAHFKICRKNVEKLCSAMKKYFRDNRRYPRELADLVPEYLDKIPVCPSAGKDTYSSSYVTDKSRKKYTLYCRGNNHIKAIIPANYPRTSDRCFVEDKPDNWVNDPKGINNAIRIYKNIENVKAILDKYPDALNQKDQYSGDTPLMSAVMIGDIEIISLLLSRGAKVDVMNRHGHTPLSIALFKLKEAKNSDQKELFNQIVKILKEHGAKK